MITKIFSYNISDKTGRARMYKKDKFYLVCFRKDMVRTFVFG